MAFNWPTSRLFGFVLVIFFSTVVLLIYRNQESINLTGYAHSVKNAPEFPLRFKNVIEKDPIPTGRPIGALIAAGRSDADYSWMIHFKAKWDVYPYNVDDPKNKDSRLRIPKNKGHEAMVYLSWIIDNYDKLPWAAMFVHGHADAWHQDDTLVRLGWDLQLPALARDGYISLRCDWYPSCPAETRPKKHDAAVWGPGVNRRETEDAIARNWGLLFPGEELPETIASQCCAQFVVTRQAILHRPKADYERLRKWLLGTFLHDDISGRVLEKVWAYIFTGEAVHCPAPQQCSCEYFGRCEKRKWTKPPEGLGPLPDWP